MADAKPQESLAPRKQLSHYITGENIISPLELLAERNNDFEFMEETPEEWIKARKQEQVKKTMELPPHLRLLFSLDQKRAEGHSSLVLTHSIKYSQDGPSTDLYFIIMFYQFVVGAVGATAVGMDTGYFTSKKVPSPMLFTTSLKELQRVTVGATIATRVMKRAILGGLLYDCLERNVEKFGTSRWFNAGIAGAVCGSIFGLRGGPRGMLLGMLAFSTFGCLSGFLQQVV